MSELIEKLEKVKSDLGEAISDYEALVILASALAKLANDPIITSPEVAQLLRDISIDSLRANHNKRVRQL